MARSATNWRKRGARPLVFPTVTLAFWRLRKTWKLLLATGLGIVAAVMFVCAVPLYTDIAMTAGLRGALTSSPQSADIVVHSTSARLDAHIVDQATQKLNHIFQKNLAPYLAPLLFSIQTQESPILGPACPKYPRAIPSETCDLIQLLSFPTDQVGHHMTLVQGRFPQTASDAIEIALTAESAVQLKATVGSILKMKVAFFYNPPFVQTTAKRVVRIMNLHVVGIFNNIPTKDPFWHGSSFLSSPRGGSGVPGFVYTGLASSEGLFSILSHTSSRPDVSRFNLELPVNLSWYYPLDPSRIAISDLDNVSTNVYNVQVDTVNDSFLNRVPYLEDTRVNLPTNILAQYKNRVPVAQIPATGILFLVLGLVLFFVSMMTDLLVDRQLDAIAILRSRGASRLQVLGSFVIQSIGLGLVALIIGPLLAIAIAYLITRLTLSPADQGALNIISNNPEQELLRLSLFAIASAVVAVIAMVIALSRSAALDMLSLRREAARSRERSLWQRLNLDVVAVIIALVGYACSVYVTNSNVLDTHLRLLLLSPLTLLGVVFLVIACMLLFLRFFPLILRLASWFSGRSRNAPLMLAMAQMARAPRRSVRLILLLTLATIFTIFTLVFTASQAQRIFDVANYQVGADFSGPLQDDSYSPLELPQLTATYRHIPGVISATLGYTTKATDSGGILGSPLEIRAVDADTFAQTAIWTEQDSTQTLTSLMAQLTAQRAAAASTMVIPAIVDEATWNALHLAPNAHFTLRFNDGNVYNGMVSFVTIAEVQHIPTINDSTEATNTTDYVAAGGILVDYKSFENVYIKDFLFYGVTVPINYVWLRTRDDDASLKSVRIALSDPAGCCLQLSVLNDRRALIHSMQDDPLYLNLIGILAIGASTAMLLALVGNLIASWLSARTRLTNFVVLRALGATPGQVASVLAWEQGILYTTGIGLGTIFGILLSLLVLPYIVYTSVISTGSSNDLSSGQFYLVQGVPPIQIIIPISLAIILLLLIAICVVALTMMVRVVSQPSMNQTLRLNED